MEWVLNDWYEATVQTYSDAGITPAAADAAPTFDVCLSNTDTPTYSGTTAAVSYAGIVGKYRVRFQWTVANGFAAGSIYTIRVWVTMGGLTACLDVGTVKLMQRDLNSSVLLAGLATAATSNSITVTGGMATDDYYKGCIVLIVAGTGAFQAPKIATGYVGSTKVLSIASTWATTPDATSRFLLLGESKAPMPGPDGGALISVGTTVAGQLQITSGVAQADLRSILGSALTETVGGRIVAAVKKFFDIASPTGTVNSLPDALPNATGGLAIVGSAMTLASGALTSVASAVWNALTSGLTTANSIGKLLVDNINATLSSRSTLTAGQVRTELATELGDIVRSAGLSGENKYIDNAVVDSRGRMTSCRLRIYSDAVSVGTENNVVATYTVTCTYEGANAQPTTYSQVKA